MTAQTDATARNKLVAQFPNWTIWRSNTGRWYGTRRSAVTEAQRHAGCARVVDADTPDELSQTLADQETRTEETP